MPEYTVPPQADQQPVEPTQPQEKICSACKTPVVFVPVIRLSWGTSATEPSAGFCSACRETVSLDSSAIRRAASRETCPQTESLLDVSSYEDDHSSHQNTSINCQSLDILPLETLQRDHIIHSTFNTPIPHTPLTPTIPSSNPRSPFPTSLTQRQTVPFTSPNPLADITRLRVRSQRHHCLYPGASFQGTQKSGRNSYEVNVTIVDVDFDASFLCGYLRIRGLTDDWPELTTYFDAEIIGSRYGFLTQNWGATEQEDMVHWQRFPAFKRVRNELKKPHLTMSDRDRGAVFMRWKERFLVPDHRVQDINGASFAGFYYVCVDFNPPSSRPSASTVLESDDSSKSESRRGRRGSNSYSNVRFPSLRTGPQPATMNGFYFHQNSEPYQQLSLSHIPERSSSSFEFR